jgi:hypothetical protein
VTAEAPPHLQRILARYACFLTDLLFAAFCRIKSAGEPFTPEKLPGVAAWTAVSSEYIRQPFERVLETVDRFPLNIGGLA